MDGRVKDFLEVLFAILLLVGVSISWVVMIVSADDEQISPFLYFYPPSNSFGMSSYKTVNPVFLKQLLKDNINWNLEYERYSYSDWVEGNEYLDIDLKWVNDSFYKIMLNFSCPVDVYHVRFTMDFSVNVLDYIEKNDNEVWFNYSTSDGIINLLFNYTDLKSISGLYFEKGIVNDWFFFRFGRYNIPSGFYSFDPIFGCIDASGFSASSHRDPDDLSGGIFTLSETGTAVNISLYVREYTAGYPCYVACLIYDDSDKSFVARTNPVLIDSTTPSWVLFTFAEGICLQAGDYILAFHVDGNDGNTGVYYYVDFTPGSGRRILDNDCGSFYPNYPFVFTNDSYNTYEVAINCGYTVGCGEPCTSNCTISDLELNDINFANKTTNVEDCRDYWNWTIDVEDCTNDIDWINITVANYGYTNHTNKGNGTYWHNYSGNMDCNTNYTIWINNSCQNGAFKNNYYYWFITEDCCQVSLDNVMVNGIDTNSSQYCFDYNATYLNVSYDVTSSCDDEIEFINVSFNNGSHVFYSQVTNEAEGNFWVNWSSIVFDCETNYTMLNFTVHDGDNCNDDWINATYWFNTCDCYVEPEGCCSFDLESEFPVNGTSCFSNSSYIVFSFWLNTSCSDYNFSYVNVSFGTNFSNMTGVAEGHVFVYFNLSSNLSCYANYSWYVVFNKDVVNCSEKVYSFWFMTCSCGGVSCEECWSLFLLYLNESGYIKEGDDVNMDIGLGLVLVVFMGLYLYLCYKFSVDYLGLHLVLFFGAVFLSVVGSVVLLDLYDNDMVVYSVIGVYLFSFGFMSLYKLVLGYEKLKKGKD